MIGFCNVLLVHPVVVIVVIVEVTCYDVEQERSVDVVRQATVGCTDDTEETQGVRGSGTDEVYPFLSTLRGFLSQRHRTHHRQQRSLIFSRHYLHQGGYDLHSV